MTYTYFFTGEKLCNKKNVYFSIRFVLKKTINTYLSLEIRVVFRKFLASKCIFIVFFRNKSDNYLYLYIRNLENLLLKLFFVTQYKFEFVCKIIISSF